MEVWVRHMARSRCRGWRAQSRSGGGCLALLLLFGNLGGCSSDPDLFDQAVERIESSTPSSTEFDTQATQPGAEGLNPSKFDAYVVGQASKTDIEDGLGDELLDVQLQFENADIKDVVVTILGDILRKEFTLDPSLTGIVTLRTSHGLSAKSLVHLMNDAVVKSGGRVRRSGSLYSITAMPAPDGKGAELSRANPTLTFLPLRHAQAINIQTLLRSVFPTAGRINVDKKNNILVLGGPAGIRRGMARTAALFDTDVLAEKTLGVYPLKYANANEVIAQLQVLYEQKEGDSHQAIQFLPVGRVNAILAATRNPSMLARLEEVIAGLDKRRSTDERLYVVELQHANAEVLAGLLTKLFEDGSGGDGVVEALGGAKTGAGLAGPANAARPGPGDQPSRNRAGIKVMANVEANSLLIFASPSEYAVVEDAITTLDAKPLQVLIEATIMEVTLNDRLTYGVQAFLREASPDLTVGFFGGVGDVLSGSFPGFNVLFNDAGKVGAVINALSAVTEVRVLSSPQITAIDNEPASLQVGDEVPVTTRQVVGTDPAAPTINSIEYRQTGVILDVVPHINRQGGVTLEVRQEVTNAPQLTSASSLTPTLTRRIIETKTFVQSGQTVALGGLVSERSTDIRDRVPLLGDIPILGALFGMTDTVKTKTELIVFLTPTVFTDPEETQEVTNELLQQIKELWTGDKRAEEN